MKGNSAKVNQIIFASVCLVVALALAVFTCFAWFTSNLNANNGLSATVSDGNITDLVVSYYALTNKTEGASATTYTVSDELTADNNGVPINAYGSTGSTITLIKVTYTVKDGTATKLIFTGSGAATFPATKTTVQDSLGEYISVYRTSLSNAVSLRLADSVTTDSGTIVTATKTAQTFCDVSELDSSGTSQTIDKDDIILRDITKDNYGSVDSSGYYDITVYVIMEYSEENVAALYPSSGASYSTPLSCTKDITLVVKSNDSSDDTDDSSSSASSSSSESSSSESSSSDSSSSQSSSSDSSSSDSSSSDSSSSGGDSSGTATTVTLSYSMSDYYSALSSVIGTNETTIYFLDNGAVSTESTDATLLAYTTSQGSSTSSSVSSTYITTGGGTGTSSGVVGRYFTIDLSDYEGYTVSITANMSSTGSSERSLILSTSNTTTSTTGSLASATSSSSSTTSDLEYEAEVTSSNSTLYLTCSGSVRVYSITITLTSATG